MDGKLIVLYGVNNVGKSTQTQRLIQRLETNGIKTKYIKYAMYNLSPSGPMINQYIRQHNPYKLSPREFQILQVLNRTQFDHKLRMILTQGIWIVAEDYVGTGIAWGVGAGVDQQFLQTLNSHLYTEDCAIYLKNKRFLKSVEKQHKHETDTKLIEKVQEIHDQLAKRYKWKEITVEITNKEVTPEDKKTSIDKVHEKIWTEVKQYI